jgi:hypothetical protein
MDKFFKTKRSLSSPIDDVRKSISTVSSRDAKLHHLYAHLQSKGGHKLHLDLSSELNSRMRIDHVFEEILPPRLRATEYHAPKNFACLKKLVAAYEEQCGAFGDYGLKYVKYLVQVCETLPDAFDFSNVTQKVLEACDH